MDDSRCGSIRTHGENGPTLAISPYLVFDWEELPGKNGLLWYRDPSFPSVRWILENYRGKTELRRISGYGSTFQSEVRMVFKNRSGVVLDDHIAAEEYMADHCGERAYERKVHFGFEELTDSRITQTKE